MASVVLAGLLRHAEGKFPLLDRRQFFAVLLLGLTGVFGYNLAVFTGLQTVPAGRAALIVALNPVGIALLSACLGGERLRAVRSLGVLISVCGAGVVITRGNLSAILEGGVGRGELTILGCVACWATYTVLGRRAMKDLSPLTVVTYSALAGMLMLAPFAIAKGALTDAPHYGTAAWIGLVFLAIGGTVLGFLWYYQGIQALGAVRAGVFINFVPVCAVLLGYLLLREPVTSALLVGGPMVILGAWLTNTGGQFGTTQSEAESKGTSRA
jgi:drug/metabolite transporter (DMT)-like permease